MFAKVAFLSILAICLTIELTFVTCSEEGNQHASFDRSNKVPLEGGSPRVPRLTSRQSPQFEGKIHCSENSTEVGSISKVVKETKKDPYKFSMKPKEDFQRIIFKMFIHNDFDAQPPYISDEDVFITRRMLEDAQTKDGWLEFQVQYYKHDVQPSLFSLGRDKLALQVTVGNLSRLLISKRWWRTHSYSGFQISVDGGADFLFDCVAQTRVRTAQDLSLAHVAEASSGPSTSLLLTAILGFGLLLGSVVAFLMYCKTRQQQTYDEAPPVPDMPKSLLLSMDKVNHSPDASHHIYEEFDEDTLSRLRQKMNASTLGKGVNKCKSLQQHPTSETPTGNDYDIPKSVSLREHTYDEPKKTKAGLLQQERVYMNETALSLIEEKIQATSGIRDSKPETHYIEMHGIVNRHSDVKENPGE